MLYIDKLRTFTKGYSFTGDSNGYDYSNTANNAYLQSKNSYQNDGNYYGTGDGSHKLSDHVSGQSLINVGNQGNIGSDIGKNYNEYAANIPRNEYAGYSNTYGNSDSDSYTSPTRAATNTLFSGLDSNSNNNAESTFNAYSSAPIYKDSDFSQFAASSTSSKRVPAYSEYSRPAIENYSGDSVNSDVQGYLGSSSSSSYSENDHVYPPYLPGGLTSEYSFGKQKNVLYNLKDSNKYNDIYSIPSETRFTRGNVGHVSHNHDVSPYISGSRPSGHFLKTHTSGIYSVGKPNKYSYKYLSRYAPNSGVTYSRERNGYYAPYGKDSRKIIIIKDGRPNYTGRVYSDESGYASSNGSYRSKSGTFMNGYSASNFDAYSGSNSNSNYNDNPTVSRRYRISGPMLMKRAIPA
ncbi:hypothetical protein EAG_14491 [Camponotus floridanus]|uniref:Uncharacterized protein n=1 Tax=Camponotus floridanus TaxID=104421 RepID=E2APU6_CAMFO|nr:hypothetical protein EAG_14491 [Camponotus floridanus]